MNKENVQLCDVDMVFADSTAAMEFGYSKGLSKEVQVYTSSPAMLINKGSKPIHQFDHGLTPDVLINLGKATRKFSDSIYECLKSSSEYHVYALTGARIALDVERLVAKAIPLTTEHYDSPVAVIDVDTGNDFHNSILNSPLSLLLSANPQMVHMTVPKEITGSYKEHWNNKASIFNRIRCEDWRSITYRLISIIYTRLGINRRKGNFLVYSLNTLIKETAVELAVKGYGVLPLNRLVPDEGEDSVATEKSLKKMLNPVVNDYIDNLLVKQAGEVIKDYFYEQLEKQINVFINAEKKWASRLDNIPNIKGILSNDVPITLTEALYKVCNQRNIPFYMFQHGTGYELSYDVHFSDCRREICTADNYYCFSIKGEELHNKNQYASGQAISIGLPSDIIRTKYRKNLFPKKKRLAYISTQLLTGNWQYPSENGLNDSDNVNYELELMKNVLSKSSIPVLYKPYPSMRYLDLNPVYEYALSESNIEMDESWMDFRYSIHKESLLMTAKGGSTVSWCLLVDVPLIFLNIPHQTTLMPEVLDKLRTSVFVFDVADDDFHKNLLAFLNKPCNEISLLWKEKAESRRDFIQERFGLTDKKAGERAARQILS